MYPYILCYCGRALGDIYDLFKMMQAQKYAEAYKIMGELEWNVDPSMLAISDIVDVNLDDVYERLHIHLDCCRCRLLSQVEFCEYY